MPNLHDCAPGSCSKEGSPPRLPRQGGRQQGLARPAPPHGPERRRGHLDEAKAGVPGGVGASAFAKKQTYYA
jgi:hypothetical protein